MKLSLVLFGPMEVTWGGAAITFATNSARALLAYLALEADRPHPRELLASFLWPEQPQAAAYNNLRQTLSRVRKALPDLGETATFLTISPQTLRFNHALATSDVTNFEELIAACAVHVHENPESCQECVDRLKEAVRLYRGEFLQGLFLEGSQPFEEWLISKRENLHRQALQALRILTHNYQAKEDFAQMRQFAMRELALDPLSEEAHAEVMLALALLGDRSAALAQYEKCRQILTAELGIEPNASTRALNERIRDGSLKPTALKTISPQTLPYPLTPFVGRDIELAALENLPEVRLLTLVGAGGMGKTRLALELAHTWQSRFPDGVFLVSLAPLTTAATIAPTIATALGLSVFTDDPRQAVLHSLRDKHLLLLMDNFEHLLDGVDIVIDILKTTQQVSIITTSRERLNVRGEYPYIVQGMDYVPDATLEEATKAAAVRLFVQSAHRVQPAFTLSAATVGEVLRICQLVQGMPLGLELAAAWTETLPLQVIAEEIEQSMDFLAAEWRDAPQRQRSLRAVFDWSWKLLNETERQVYKRLSIFRGGFTREAAQVVAGASLQLLMSLQRKSLVRRREIPNTGGWYEIHEVLRQFAAEYLDATSDEHTLVANQLSAFYLELAETAVPKFYSQEQIGWLDRIEREHDNIRLALAWLTQQGQLETALRLAGALRYFWFVRGYHKEGSEQLLRILAQPGAIMPTTARVTALNAAGYLQWVRSNEQEAQALLTTALAISRVINDQTGTAFALCYLGAVTNAYKEYASASEFLEESLVIWRSLNEENGIGLALMFLGDSMLGVGEYERARRLFTESVDLFRRLGNTSVLPYPLRRLGYLAQEQGELGQATMFHAESMKLNWEVGDRQGVAASLIGLAGVAGTNGDWARVANLLGAVEAIVESSQIQLLAFDHDQRNQILALFHSQRDNGVLSVAWAEGREMCQFPIRGKFEVVNPFDVWVKIPFQQ